MATKSERTAGIVAKVTCIAHRTNGRPCANRPMKGQNVCKNHGGAAPAARRKASERILMAQDLAAAKLIELMNDPSVPPGVRRMAAADLLDRGGNVAAHVLAIPGLGDAAPAFEMVLAELTGGSRAESRAVRGVADEETPDWLAEGWRTRRCSTLRSWRSWLRHFPLLNLPPAHREASPATGMMTMEDALEQLRATSPPTVPLAPRRDLPLNRGDYIDPSDARRTFREVAELWFESRNLRPKTAQSYRTILEQRIYPAFGDRAVGSITTMDLVTWITGLSTEGKRIGHNSKPANPESSRAQCDARHRERAGKTPTGKPLAPGTVHNAVRVMRQVLDAVRARYLRGNPAHGLTRADLPKAQRDATATPYLSATQVERLAVAVEDVSADTALALVAGALCRADGNASRGVLRPAMGERGPAPWAHHRCGVHQHREERRLVRGPTKERQDPRRPDAASATRRPG